MIKKRYKDWVEYYSIKALQSGDLNEISGYNHGMAQITRKGLKDTIETAKEFLALKKKDTLLDVGCGAGLFTIHLLDYVDIIVGIDASSEMIKRASTTNRFIKITALADQLPFPDQSFNKVFCHSIFQYFPNYKYAARVIAEMLRVIKPGGRCLIMDIPDIAKREDYMGVKTQDSHNLKRIFYSREWFINLLPNAEIFERKIREYKNSKFRFNLLLRK